MAPLSVVFVALVVALTNPSLVFAETDPSLDKDFGFRVCRDNEWARVGASFQDLIEETKEKNPLSQAPTRIVAKIKALSRQREPTKHSVGSLEYRPHYLVAQKLSTPANFGQWMIPAANGIRCDVEEGDLVAAKHQTLERDTLQGGIDAFLNHGAWDEYLERYGEGYGRYHFGHVVRKKKNSFFSVFLVRWPI